ncbi:hypothetical protein E2C01_078059 [Portunus trituberculatus]|uniref:Uncharacterized protein n=1 Tax=Portunus trituberculatus TaxID=210409 RepID=A0A5B7IG07_PORTR|nr:hypothetical protein [Portunus trituberculatus]
MKTPQCPFRERRRSSCGPEWQATHMYGARSKRHAPRSLPQALRVVDATGGLGGSSTVKDVVDAAVGVAGPHSLKTGSEGR